MVTYDSNAKNKQFEVVMDMITNGFQYVASGIQGIHPYEY